MAVTRLDPAASGVILDGERTNTISYPVSAGSDRYLLIGLVEEAETIAGGQATVTYGGVAMTRLFQATINNAAGSDDLEVTAFGLGEAGLQSASGSIVVIGGVTGNTTWHAHSYQGVHQGILSVDRATIDGSSPNPLTSNKTPPAGALICFAGVGNVATADWSVSGMTKQTEAHANAHSGSSADILLSSATVLDVGTHWSVQNRAAWVSVNLLGTPPSAQTIPLGVASETDSAPALTIAPGTATVALGVAEEIDSVPGDLTASSDSLITLGIASETDSAPALTMAPGDATISLGAASETDSVAALSVSIAERLALKEDTWTAEGDMPLILITIDHDDLPSAIRVVNNNENVVSRGEEFIAFPFDIAIPDSLENAPPSAKLRIDNVSREIGQAIRLIRSPPRITIEIVRMETPDIVEMSFPEMRLRNVRVDALTVSGDLAFEDLTREPYPAHTFSPANFPGLVQ